MKKKKGGERKLPPLTKQFHGFVASVVSGAALKSWTPTSKNGRAAA